MADATNLVGKPRLERSKHTWKYRKLLDCDMGEVIPIQCDLMMPGDVCRLHLDFVTRLKPLVAPILQEIDLDTHTFFVPIRIVDEDFADDENGSLSGGVFRPGDPDKGSDGLTTKTFPRWQPHTNPPQKHSLWDYFGHPVGKAVGVPYPTDWHRRAYWKIFNDFFRNQHLQKEVNINDVNNENVFYRNFRKDYFTNAMPHTQEGVPPSLPITGQTHAEFAGAESFLPNTLGVRQMQGLTPPSGANYMNPSHRGGGNIPANEVGTIGARFNVSNPFGNYFYNQIYAGDPLVSERPTVELGSDWTFTNMSPSPNQQAYSMAQLGIKTNQDLLNWLNTNTVDLSTLSTFDVNDLRNIIQMHKFMERNTRIGLRYTEQLQGRWRISPRDERLQRPEFLGGTRSPIIISEVLQTSQTTQGTTGSPQGTMAGHGLTASIGKTKKYLVKEWGYLITLMSIMPKVGYTQGIDRQYLYESRYDLPTPEFMHLGEREILQTELFTTDSEAQNRTIFGYRGIYDEHRLKNSMVCGDMRDTFDYWHLYRQFATAPLLNKEFISTENNIRKDIFAVQNEKGFIVHCGIRINMIKSLPRIAEPGLMDHF